MAGNLPCMHACLCLNEYISQVDHNHPTGKSQLYAVVLFQIVPTQFSSAKRVLIKTYHLTLHIRVLDRAYGGIGLQCDFWSGLVRQLVRMVRPEVANANLVSCLSGPDSQAQ
jgi:hypothetical protein